MTRPADPALEDTPSLEDLLAASSPDNLALTEEDRAWFNMKLVDKEL